ncbi:glutamine amidotransferase-related protein [Azospirillum sp. ST 5-10]|uniref:glutamine amidotransferase-related protein n=1 Tax=unclassified Azospirillum TaxID=2630922 RepID=UPI003F49E37E
MPRLQLVVHDTGEPALDGAVAGLLAARSGARLRRLRGDRDLAGPDVRQHVLAGGRLAPNGLLWAERASGVAVDTAVEIAGARELTVADAPADRPLVVAVNPRVAGAAAAATFARDAEGRGWPVDVLRVAPDGAALVARSRKGDVGRWRRDGFGRVVPDGTPATGPAGPPLRIVILGTETYHRHQYPAVLAALGDAADALGRALVIRFRAPDDGAAIRAMAVEDADGLVLPGGSDMGQVAGQIAAARLALTSGLPTVGLCLGMQSMATAAVRERLGLEAATLAEADPAAPIHSVVLRPAGPGGGHRLGDDASELRPGSHLARLYGRTRTVERYNHRYVLDPALVPDLERVGVRVPARSVTHGTADAVEAADHPFFIGMQGHPELNSAPGRPHPLLHGFLEAAAGRSRAAA